MNKTGFLVLGICVVIAAVFYDTFQGASLLTGVFFPKTQTAQPIGDADYKAGFAVMVNDEPRSFKPSLYFNLSPDAYIEASNPNIVHVKRKGTTWDDFFKTLPLKLTATCFEPGTGQLYCADSIKELRFILNGQSIPNALDLPIEDGDRLLVTYGIFDDLKLQNQFQSVVHPNQ